MNKNAGRKKYSAVPDKIGEITKTIHNKNCKIYKIYVMTIVDSITGWFELAQLTNKPNVFICKIFFDSTWLACYPCPREINSNNKGEFMAEFSMLCDNMGVKKSWSSSWNPQSNSILEESTKY